MEGDRAEEQQRILAQLKAALRQALDEQAYDRMMNVMLVNQNLFAAASQKILAISQRLGRTVTEKEVLTILQTLKQEPKTGGISIRRK